MAARGLKGMPIARLRDVSAKMVRFKLGYVFRDQTGTRLLDLAPGSPVADALTAWRREVGPHVTLLGVSERELPPDDWLNPFFLRPHDPAFIFTAITRDSASGDACETVEESERRAEVDREGDDVRLDDAICCSSCELGRGS
jgi:hypothetical protein